jgi:hypothetical protein
MNVSSVSQESKVTGNKPCRCPVFKIDLRGRFVNVDDLTAGILGYEPEYYFGKSIEEFLDEKSFESIQSILALGRNYETFYKSVNLTFIDADRNTHSFESVISLNFIGGNPANFQFILTNISSERISIAEKREEKEISSGDQLIRLIARVENDIDWNELSGVLLNYPNIIQVAIYLAAADRLIQVADKAIDADDRPKIDLSKVDQSFFNSFLNSEIDIPANNKPEADNNMVDYCLPLIWNGEKWGMVRFITDCESSELSEWLISLAGFVGNSLGGVICRQGEQSEPYSGEKSDQTETLSFIGALKDYNKGISKYAVRLSADSYNRLRKDGRICLNAIQETFYLMEKSINRMESQTECLNQDEKFTDVNFKKIIEGIIEEPNNILKSNRDAIECDDLLTIRTQKNKIHTVFLSILSNIRWLTDERRTPVLKISSILENGRNKIIFDINKSGSRNEQAGIMQSSFIKPQRSDEGDYLAGPELLLISKIIRSLNGELVLQGDFYQTASIIIYLKV